MRHTQDSIREFPDNARPYPHHPDPKRNRVERQKAFQSRILTMSQAMSRLLTKRLGARRTTRIKQLTPQRGIYFATSPVACYQSQKSRERRLGRNNRKTTLRQSTGGRGRIGTQSLKATTGGLLMDLFGVSSQLVLESKNKRGKLTIKDKGGVSTSAWSAVSDWDKKNQGEKSPGVAVRPNPGWLPLSKDQHRAHEAPGRLEAPNKLRPGDMGEASVRPKPPQIVEESLKSKTNTAKQKKPSGKSNENPQEPLRMPGREGLRDTKSRKERSKTPE